MGGSGASAVRKRSLRFASSLSAIASARLPVIPCSLRVASTSSRDNSPGARNSMIRVLSLPWAERSEEHTSELQSLMRISYAVFCLKKKKTIIHYYTQHLTYTSEHTHT